MAFPNIFENEVTEGLISRLNNLTPDAQPQWGKMDVAKMLAHVNVAYESIYEPDKHPKPNFLMKLFLKSFVKGYVTGEAPLKKNSMTAPQFIIKSDKDFDAEKTRLIDYLRRVQTEGESSFEGRESHSFGPLTAREYSNMMYKHLDHHLRQFSA